MKQIQIIRKNSTAIKILKELNNNPIDTRALKICRNGDLTPHTIYPNIKVLIDLGFIEMNCIGKRKNYFITKKGREFLYKIMEIERKLEK